MQISSATLTSEYISHCRRVRLSLATKNAFCAGDEHFWRWRRSRFLLATNNLELYNECVEKIILINVYRTCTLHCSPTSVVDICQNDTILLNNNHLNLRTPINTSTTTAVIQRFVAEEDPRIETSQKEIYQSLLITLATSCVRNHMFDSGFS